MFIINIIGCLILVGVAVIIEKLSRMSQESDAIVQELTSKVEANNTLIGSGIELIQGLKKALDDAAADPVKLKALSDSLGAKDQEFADAIVANTPAAPQ